MDYQNRVGSKKGSGGMADASQVNAQRQQRLRQLALETINLEKDPYIVQNHYGSFECRLCLTTHQSDSSYLAHTQGRKHQTNLARREALLNKDRPTAGSGPNAIQVKKTVKIGRPGYKITKVKDGSTGQVGLLFHIKYPEIGTGVVPRVRFMSAYEQTVDLPPDKSFQYLLVAAEPYETCGFKIEAREVDRDRYFTYYDPDQKEFYVQVLYKNI